MRFLWLTRLTLRAAALTAIAGSGAHSSIGQEFEFHSSRFEGRVDHYSQTSLWGVADQNRNGITDPEEFLPPQINVGRMAGREPYFHVDLSERPITLEQDSDEDDSEAEIGDLGTRNYLRSESVQLLHVLSFRDVALPHEGLQATSTIEFAYGVCYLESGELFGFLGLSDFLRDNGVNFGNYVESLTVNQTAGALGSVRWIGRAGRWKTTAGASLSRGVNSISAHQRSSLGEFVIPGGFNQSVSLQPVERSSHLRESDLTASAEVNLRVSYDLSRSLQLFAGYDLLYLADIRGAQSMIIWRLPTMGLADRGGDGLTQSTVGVGMQWSR